MSADTGVMESIRYYARELKLPTFAQLEESIRQFKPEESLEEFILELMKREYHSRQENHLKKLIRQAHFPMLKTLDEFRLEELQHVKPAFIQQLATGELTKRRENIVMVGNPGTGKTHLTIALGLKACASGYRVVFRTATSLAAELREARNEYQLRKLINHLGKTDLLLLDELSYASFDKEESELLFKVIAERSERASTIITTNLEFSQWPDLFENKALVAALVDRLTYRSHVLNMNGKSHRLRAAKHA